MNLALGATLAVAVLAAQLATFAKRISRTPPWEDLADVWPIGAFTALVAVVDLAALAAPPSRLALVLAHAQLASALLLIHAWLRFAGTLAGTAPVVAPRTVGLVAWAAAGAAMVPGMALDTCCLFLHTDALSGSTWRAPAMTPAGHALVALGVVGAGWAGARLLRAWGQASSTAGALAIAFLAAFALAAADYAVRTHRLAGTRFGALPFVVPLAAAGWHLTRRFAADAAALHALRTRLEGLVEERTRELAATQFALLQAEKLAALGQFAAGVAHEVNNPASVVTANLAHLSQGLGRGLDAAEAREVTDESLDAMRRINDLVRKLLDAGRLADVPPDAGNVPLAAAVEEALSELGDRTRGDIEVARAVPGELRVRGGPDLVERIVANLLANALEAIPIDRPGHVRVRASADGGSVRLSIEDDGGGMSADQLRRAFDPFFTTKPPGRGNGLGLPVTRGLVEGIGGQVWLESEPGAGTRAIVELPAARPA